MVTVGPGVIPQAKIFHAFSVKPAVKSFEANCIVFHAEGV